MRDKVRTVYFNLIRQQFDNMDVHCRIVEYPPTDWSVEVRVRAVVLTLNNRTREYRFTAHTSTLVDASESRIQSELDALCHYMKRHMCNEMFTPSNTPGLLMEGL